MSHLTVSAYGDGQHHNSKMILCKADPRRRALGSHSETSLTMLDIHVSIIQNRLKLAVDYRLIPSWGCCLSLSLTLSAMHLSLSLMEEINIF